MSARLLLEHSLAILVKIIFPLAPLDPVRNFLSSVEHDYVCSISNSNNEILGAYDSANGETTGDGINKVRSSVHADQCAWEAIAHNWLTSAFGQACQWFGFYGTLEKYNLSLPF